MDALKKLLDNEKGIVAVLLILGATAFVLFGKMTVAEWQSFAAWIFGAYAGSTALHEAAVAIGGSKLGQTVEAVAADLAKPAAPAPAKEGGAA